LRFFHQSLSYKVGEMTIFGRNDVGNNAQSEDKEHHEGEQPKKASYQLGLVDGEESLDLCEAYWIWVDKSEPPIRQFVLAWRILRIEAVLPETPLTRLGTRDNGAQFEPCAINRSALETTAPVGIWEIAFWYEATDGVAVDLIDEESGVLKGVG
jgi:hypothetical protein